MREIKLRNI